jgi:zinc-ribbon domain
VRCPRCGNENPASNRFCGMCGATLLQAPAPVVGGPGQGATAQTAPQASPQAAAPAHAAEQPTTRTAPPRETPVISGPSFLGLSQPAPTTRRRGSLSIDPHSAPSSGNLDYLLEDDEPKHGGAWKFVLIVVALALAVGLGYLRWKDQGFGWLSPGAKKPAVATENSDAQDSGAAAPSSSSTPNASPAPAANQPATGGGAQPATDGSAPSSTSASPPPVSASPAPTNPATSAATPAPAPADGEAGAPTSRSGSAAASPLPATKDSSPDPNVPSVPPAKAEKPRPAPAEPASRPPAAIRTAKAAADPVAEARKYLYGKGARQDCDRGMRLLKPAADQANSKAMIEMGALYSAGLCAPRDLPTAYRWFAMALRKDPENVSVQADLQKLWGEMTQPERQLAIRLSQ